VQNGGHLLRSVTAVALLFVATASNGASSPADAPKVPPDKPQRLIAPYWTLEPGWHTALEIRNNAATRSLTITPTLRSANGDQLALDPVTLGPRAATKLDLALAAAKYAPLLGDRAYGSVLLQFNSPMAFNVYAATMVHMPGKAIAYHFDATDELSGMEAGTYEGIWWMPSANARGQMMLSNSSQQPVNAVVTWFDSGGRSQSSQLSLPPGQSRRLDVRDALTRGNLTGDHGGLRVQLGSKAGSVFLGHILFDETANFGGTVKMFEKYKFHRGPTNTIRAPMIALSEPDPALNFPIGTKLNPMVFVRNTTSGPKDVSVAIRWFDGDKTAEVTVPFAALSANETRALSLRQLQTDGTLPSTARFAAVHFTHQGDTGDLVALAASYDDTMRYGAQSPFGDMVSRKLVGTMWTADALHNSIISVGNAGASPAEVAISLVSADGTFRYELPHAQLNSREQTWVDIGKLIRGGVPDRNGNAFPAGMTTGTYEIEDLKNMPNGFLYEGKLVTDKTYGHVGYGCAQCCAYSQPWQTLDPLSFSFGTNQQKVWSTDCSTLTYDVSNFSYGWFVYDETIATVQDGGWVNAGSPGWTVATAYIDLQTGAGHECPIETFTPTASIEVPLTINATATVVWWFNGENPSPGTYPTSITLTSSGGANTTWSVPAGGNRISLSRTTGTSTTVTSSGQHFSRSSGDITVKASVPNGTEGTITLTTKTPWKLALNAQASGGSCDLQSTNVYRTSIAYDVIDSFGVPMTTDTAWSESVGAATNDNGSNWASFGLQTSGSNITVPVTDVLAAPTASNASPSPQCVYPNNPTNSTRYMFASQTIRIGSSTSGNGNLVQTDTLTYFRDHGAHANITVPSQPPQ